MNWKTLNLFLVLFCVMFEQTLTTIFNFGNIVTNLEDDNTKILISNQCLYKKNVLIKKTNETKYDRRYSRNNVNHGQRNPDLPAVVKLLNYISEDYINTCTTVILYDEFYGEQMEFLKILFSTYPLTLMQGRSGSYSSLAWNSDKMCKQFLLFLKDPKQANSIVGDQSQYRVIVVTQTSRWRVEEFLSSPVSRKLVNLLVIRIHNIMDKDEDGYDIMLYTHDLFVDGLGSSSLRVLAAWRCGTLTQPNISLFPEKMKEGFKGHKFTVSAGNQPPFIVRRGHYYDGKKKVSTWDGLEMRVLWLLEEALDFSMEIIEPEEAQYLPEAPNAVVKQVKEGLADIGVGGIYITSERLNDLALSSPITLDCATFMTLTSTALPRYRAIMGPFHWTVWLALTLAYLLAIFPISFSDTHSLTHLLRNPWEVENMFWYVFGTFTNCFTFKGKTSWTNSNKAATRMLIGWYWLFSIIISACYTSSIIAFVTLPVYPPHYDNYYDVVQQHLQVGTLAKGGWQYWFNDTVDPIVMKMFEKMEYLPDLESALQNVTTSYYRNYAFLGSSSLLEYIMKTNYTKRSEDKSFLYLGKECFVSFSTAMAFPPQAPYSKLMSQKILRIIQSGLVIKLKRDLDWDLQRSSSGRLLAAVSGFAYTPIKVLERKLTLEDVQGMFLLLGAGFAIATFVLTIEITAWLLKYIRAKCFNNEADEEKNNTKPTEHLGSCDFAPDSQQRIFLNEFALKRRNTPAFESANSSLVFRTPKVITNYKNGQQYTDLPDPSDLKTVNQIPISLHLNRSEIWKLPEENVQNWNSSEGNYFGDAIHEHNEDMRSADITVDNYVTRSMYSLLTKENSNTGRAFTF